MDEPVNMHVISLKVTSPYDAGADRCIVTHDATITLGIALDHASAESPLHLRLCDCIFLDAIEAGLLRRSCNQADEEGFDRLYDFLARRPGEPARFLCEITPWP